MTIPSPNGVASVLDEARLNVGFILRVLGRPSEGMPYLEGSLALARKCGDRACEALAEGNLGTALLAERAYAAARERFERSMDLMRELGDQRGEVGAHMALGQLAFEEGGVAEAQDHFDTAIRAATDWQRSDLCAQALAWRARLPGGDVQRALDAVVERGDLSWVSDRMEAWLCLAHAMGSHEHLAEARRLLDHLVEHAPAEYRESMLENVPLHRDILRAWAANGAD